MPRAYPPIETLVPHAGPMRLIGDVIDHRPERTRCRVEVDRSRLFQRDDGTVPAWVGIEYLAQCVAAHGGLVAHGLGLPARPGLFLGSRSVELHVESFESGATLCAEAQHLRGDLGLVSFACRLTRDAGDVDALVEGNLNVYVVENIEQLLETRP